MKLYQAFAVFIVLIGSCTGLCSKYGQFKTCEQIIDTFEEALIKEESNIFALNDLFFPSNRHPASNFVVGYIIIRPGQDGNSTIKFHVRGWCKSTSYTIASPLMLRTLFTGLTYIYHMSVSRQLIMPSILLLNITDHNFNEKEIDYILDYALDYITPWLKLYTRKEAQSGEITYKDEEKGYMCDTVSFSWVLMVITVIVTITTICILCKVLYFLLNTESKQADVKRAVFFSMGFVAFLVNIVDVIILAREAHIYIIQGKIDEKYNPIFQNAVEDLTFPLGHRIVKVSQVVVGILVFGIGGFNGCCCSTSLPKAPQLILNYFCHCVCASNCAYFLCFANLFYFTYMVGLNVLPTFLLLFITPIETFSVLVFFVSLLSSAVMVVTIIIFQSEIHKKMNGTRHIRKLCATIVSAVIHSLVLISIVLLIGVFLKILASVNTSNTLYLAPVILSFGSTILSILGGYVTMRILSKKNNTQNSNESEMESGTEISERTIEKDSDDGEDTEEKPLLQDVDESTL